MSEIERGREGGEVGEWHAPLGYRESRALHRLARLQTSAARKPCQEVRIRHE